MSRHAQPIAQTSNNLDGWDFVPLLGFEQLRNTAAILKAYPQVREKIGGYTDNSGDPGANRRLSEARAIAVMNALKDNGIAADRVEAEGYGDQHPIADNSTPEGRARNRRVAIRITSR